MSHRNVSIYSDDSALVIRLASAFRNSGNRLHLARGQEELLVPVFLKYLDLLLIDEHLAAIDTWNITGLVRQFAGPGRQIVVVGLVEKLDMDLMARTRDYGVDAFLLKSSIGDQLLTRIEALSRLLPIRTEEPEWSPFLEHARFLEELRGKIQIIDVAAKDGMAAMAQTQAGMASLTSVDGLSLTVSWKDADELDRKRQSTTRFRVETGAESGSASSTKINTKSVATLPNLIGHTFGKVLIQREIGRGGGGLVYAGRHTSLDMQVAVKVLYPELARRDTEFASRFLGEARTAARITNGAMIRVIDCDRNPETGCYYIVMEHIDGNSLEDEIKQVGWVPEMRLTEMAVEVALCLKEAESLGIVHRDIKPANIMITGAGAMKVADLGLAKTVEQPVGIATGALKDPRIPTNTGMIVGTPFYIAPEQIEGHDLIDSRADIYSLGATLFHAATGTRPFEARKVSDLFYHHLNTRPDKITDRREEYSPQFARIVDRMLAKEPKLRYTSCRELHGVFRDHLHWLIKNDKGSRGRGLLGRITHGIRTGTQMRRR